MEYRILIVEDDRSIAEAIAAHMAQWGLSAEMRARVENAIKGR